MCTIKEKGAFMWQQWLNLLAGIWLIISPYIGFTAAAMTTNMVVTGIIVAALALWGALEHNSTRMGHMTR